MHNPIIVALDGMDVAQAARFIDELSGAVAAFKFNDLLLDADAPTLLYRSLKTTYFLDLKLHDIPNTVRNQVRRLLNHRAIAHDRAPSHFLTVHASGGAAMMKAAVEEAGSRFRILAVTILTSLDDVAALRLYNDVVPSVVRQLMTEAKDAGVWGVVCSPHEVSIARELGLRAVVPGVRPEWYQTADDQKRVATPKEAIDNGASYLVIGRPITKSERPYEAVTRTLNEIGSPMAVVPAARDFLSLALEASALHFGEFVLKSGRRSPYFFDAGQFHRGDHLRKLGMEYARLIERHWPEATIVCGPAYKGIPLAVATAEACAERKSFVSWCGDRKEEKAHGGDQNLFVGDTPSMTDSVVIIDDVMTTGQTKLDFVKKIKSTGAKILGVAIALDRQETPLDDQSESAVQLFTQKTGIPVVSLANLDDLCGYMESVGGERKHIENIRAYREKYGVKTP